MDDSEEFNKKKGHQARHSGRKAEKKAQKNKHEQALTAQQRNPKAFAFKSAVKAQKQFSRTQDLKAKKHHVPVVDRTPLEPPPVVVVIVGGPKVGKSTLLQCLIRNYTRQKLTSIHGPVNVIAGKKRRLTFIEAVNDVNVMIDLAKIADIALLLIDATFGIEMEVFEFLEICRQHGSPRIMGVLNHLDMLKDNKALKKKKKDLKRRFEVELYPGAKLFYLSSIVHGEYLKNEVKNLGRFISVMKFRPMAWRADHPYMLADRWEDITNPEEIRKNPKCDRDVILYGYVRGIPFQQSQKVHIPGCGDFSIKDISFLPDPCPLPETIKKRSLNTKERLVYAPMSGVGGVVYDKDAIYIDLGGSHHGNQMNQVEEGTVSYKGTESIFQPLLNLQKTSDEKRGQSQIKLFADSQAILDVESEDDDAEVEEDVVTSKGGDGLPNFKSITNSDGVVKRVAMFDDEADNDSDEDDDDNEEDEDDDSNEEDEDDDSNEEDEDADDDDDESEDNDEDDDESEGEDEELLPKKKPKLESDLNCNESFEEYDLDSELKRIKSTTQSKIVEKASSQPLPIIKNLRINKDADIVSKVGGILSSLSSKSETKAKHSVNKETSTKKKLNLTQLSQSEDSGISDEEEFIIPALPKDNNEKSISENDENETDEETEFRVAMFKEVSDKFYQNQTNVNYLRKFIYDEDEIESNDEDDNEEDVGGMFKRKKSNALSLKRNASLSSKDVMDNTDTSRYTPSVLRDWSGSLNKASIKDCFVTGEWADHENAQTLLNMDAEDEDLYGDVYDYESAQSVKKEASEKERENDEEKKEEEEKVVVKKEELTAKQKRLEKKRRLKDMFDSEYDDKGSSEYFDNLKNETTQQAELNRKEFEGMDDETRVKYEGYRPGLYVRMKFRIFGEFIVNFDADYPVIVGGLKELEENPCFTQARFKVHRWFPKILKNRDPLYISMGWRRFQSVMYYAKREDNFRLRSLKYAKKYLHIETLFWGYTVAGNTGFAAFQSLSNKKESSFRIAATGVVLESDNTSKIVKKLKLMGNPEEIHDKTAFIKGMFNSSLEVAKVEGAKVQTQSGIRGIIKKSKGHNGVFRCTFEDTIKKSDVVILKSWVPIKLEKFCCLVRNSLLESPKQWKGMKTVGEIKKEKNIKTLVNPDHLYTEIQERRTYIPLPMRVPRKLQRALPYDLKPKITPKTKRPERVLVVKDKAEIEMDNFVKRAKLMMEDKKEKESLAKKERHKKLGDKIENMEGMKRMREARKKAYACKQLSQKKKKKV